MLFALMLKNGRRVTSTLDPIWSCVHSVVPSLLNGTCEVTALAIFAAIVFSAFLTSVGGRPHLAASRLDD